MNLAKSSIARAARNISACTEKISFASTEKTHSSNSTNKKIATGSTAMELPLPNTASTARNLNPKIHLVKPN